MNQPLSISLRNLSKRFGTWNAVDKIDLDIAAGEFICIMGSSGCGKTTTLRMIAGLEHPSEGDIFIGDRRVNDVKPWHRDVPMVWQNFALFPHLSVADNVAYGLKMRDVPRAEREARVSKVLGVVGLESFGNRSVNQLSGGQKQRVGLARALVLDPKVLLLDEPLGALDAKIGRSMQLELRRLHKTLGITFVYVTHSQAEAMALADRIVLMNGGRIEQIGTPEDMLYRPASAFVADFMGATNLIEAEVIDSTEAGLTLRNGLGRFTLPVPKDRKIQLGKRLTFTVGIDQTGLARADRPEVNAVTGILTASENMGGLMSLHVEAGGRNFQARLPTRSADLGGLVVGDPITLHWSGLDAFLLA